MWREKVVSGGCLFFSVLLAIAGCGGLWLVIVGIKFMFVYRKWVKSPAHSILADMSRPFHEVSEDQI